MAYVNVLKQADILVCSVGSSLNLSIGAIARAMSQAAGPKLQDALELIKATKSHLRQGEVVYTIAGNLPCNHVVFCVCCPWNDGKGDAKQVRCGQYVRCQLKGKCHRCSFCCCSLFCSVSQLPASVVSISCDIEETAMFQFGEIQPSWPSLQYRSDSQYSRLAPLLNNL